MTAASWTAGWVNSSASSSAAPMLGQPSRARSSIRHQNDLSTRVAKPGKRTRGDLQALVFDQLLDAVGDEKDVAAVYTGNVSRVKVALAVNGLVGGLRVVEVALHDVGTLDPQLALLVVAKQLAAHGVDDLGGLVGQQPADRA